MRTPLKIFMFGYWGWGNATKQLIDAASAVEASKDFKPPVFVDIRIHRDVRLMAFTELDLRRTPDRIATSGCQHSAIWPSGRTSKTTCLIRPSAIRTMPEGFLTAPMNSRKRDDASSFSAAALIRATATGWLSPNL